MPTMGILQRVVVVHTTVVELPFVNIIGTLEPESRKQTA